MVKPSCVVGCHTGGREGGAHILNVHYYSKHLI